MNRCLECSARFTSASWACPDCGFSPAIDRGLVVFAPHRAAEIAGYDPALYDAHGGELSEQSFWTTGRAALIAWALQRYAPRARRFLEVGCGTGGVLAHLERACPDLELVGADALTAGLRVAAARLSRTTLLQMDATRIPFADEFDGAGAFDVIEHVTEDREVLAALLAAIRPGGVLLLTVPQHPFLFGPADEAARHVRRYRRSDLVAKVRALGCGVECVTSFVSLLFPVMVAVRLRARWRGGRYDSAAEYRAGALNDAGRRAMDLERWAIRHGVRWPFGGSLLLVARRASP